MIIIARRKEKGKGGKKKKRKRKRKRKRKGKKKKKKEEQKERKREDIIETTNHQRDGKEQHIFQKESANDHGKNLSLRDHHQK